MIVLGRIVAPFGIQGWVKIHPFGDDPLSWGKMSRWWLSADADAPEAEWKPYLLKACRAQGRSLVAAFDEVADRSGAEAIGQMYIAAPREALPAPEKDEYYWADLTGLTVENLAGERLGSVSGLMETGAHAVLQVHDGDSERLIPFVEAFVKDVDVPAGVIRVEWEKDW